MDARNVYDAIGLINIIFWPGRVPAPPGRAPLLGCRCKRERDPQRDPERLALSGSRVKAAESEGRKEEPRDTGFPGLGVLFLLIPPQSLEGLPFERDNISHYFT